MLMILLNLFVEGFEMKTYMNQLKEGCKEEIKTFYDGEEFGIGWKCGENADGIILYCKSCWNNLKVASKIEVTQRKMNKLERDLE